MLNQPFLIDQAEQQQAANVAANYGSTDVSSSLYSRHDSDANNSNMGNNNELPFTLPLRMSVSSEHVAVGEATILSEIFNISKNLIGGGVLSLSGGIAMYADSPKAVISAILWVIVLGATFAYFCVIIGKSCNMTNSGTYRECWERTVGQKGRNFVSLINILDPLLGIYANASILSQSLQLLLEGIDVYWSVRFCLLVITIFGLLPLCLMKNLNALAPYSAIGMIAVGVALIAMMVRWLDGSYLEGGIYYDQVTVKPSFGTSSHPWSISALPYLCMVYTSFDMHYNSPTYYVELKDASVPRFATTVAWAFAITSVLYFAIGVVGFLTFGSACDSYILNNYSSKDPLATIGRLTIGLCSLFSYPLNYICIRDSVIELYQLQDLVRTKMRLNIFTLLFMTLLTITECYITDLGLINSVGGGTTVTVICFVLPAMMFREGIRKYGGSTDKEEGDEIKEVYFVNSLAAVGVILGILGVYNAIETA